MKNILLLLSLILLINIDVFSQVQYKRCLYKNDKIQAYKKASKPNLRNLNSGGDTLWIEDFSNLIEIDGVKLPLGWTTVDSVGVGAWLGFDNDFGQGGAFTNGEDTQLDTDGYVTLPADFHNCVPGSGPDWEMVASPELVDATLFSSPIDVSTFNTENVLLQFKTNFRLCCSSSETKLDVMLSNDNGNTWGILDGREIDGFQISIGENPGNPVFWEQNITEIIAGKTEIRIAFRMHGGSHYFWSIDDVCIIQKQDNDIELFSSFISQSPIKTLSDAKINGNLHSLDFYNTKYAQIPYNFKLPLHLGALLHQEGVEGVNTKVEFNITREGESFWNGISVSPTGNEAVIQSFTSAEDSLMYTDTTNNYANAPLIYDPGLGDPIFIIIHHISFKGFLINLLLML